MMAMTMAVACSSVQVEVDRIICLDWYVSGRECSGSYESILFPSFSQNSAAGVNYQPACQI